MNDEGKSKNLEQLLWFTKYLKRLPPRGLVLASEIICFVEQYTILNSFAVIWSLVINNFVSMCLELLKLPAPWFRRWIVELLSSKISVAFNWGIPIPLHILLNHRMWDRALDTAWSSDSVEDMVVLDIFFDLEIIREDPRKISKPDWPFLQSEYRLCDASA